MRSDDEIEYIATRVGIENLTKPEIVRLQKIELDRAARMYRFKNTGSLEPTPGELRRTKFKHGGKVSRGRSAATSAEKAR